MQHSHSGSATERAEKERARESGLAKGNAESHREGRGVAPHLLLQLSPTPQISRTSVDPQDHVTHAFGRPSSIGEG